MEHKDILKSHVLHVAFGAIIFIFVAFIAVVIDIISGNLKAFGASDTTVELLASVSHILLLADLLLLLIHTGKSSYDLIKEMFT